MITLRGYQQAALDAIHGYLVRNHGNPCAVLPTGSGKTPVIARLCEQVAFTKRCAFCQSEGKESVYYYPNGKGNCPHCQLVMDNELGGRVLVLAHVKELLEQSAEKLRLMAPELSFGMYSAGLGARDTSNPVIVAGIQSVYNKAYQLGCFNLIIIDECHFIPSEGDGMYRTLLESEKTINPKVRMLGLTATPYRLKGGLICAPENPLNEICYEVGVKELIRDGYLCPLKSKAGAQKAETESLHVRDGEFVQSEMESVMNVDDLVLAAVSEIVTLSTKRQSVLIFATSVAHAQKIQSTFRVRRGLECALVTGETPATERAEILARFKGDLRCSNLFGDDLQPLKYLVNVNVLTTGFDAPNVDCVVLLRPTASPGLYYQMVGRGFRLHPQKEHTLILDYGGNILRHGPIDQITLFSANTGKGGEKVKLSEAPMKECPYCHNVIFASFAICPECQFEFQCPPRHDATASDAGIISGEETIEYHDVQHVEYSYAVGKKSGLPYMRVRYFISLTKYFTECVCVEHTDYAYDMACKWWEARSRAIFPENVEEAIAIGKAGGIAESSRIKITRNGSPFPTIESENLVIPDVPPSHAIYRPTSEIDDDDVPF